MELLPESVVKPRVTGEKAGQVNRWFAAACILAPLGAVPAYSAPLSGLSVKVPEPRPDHSKGLKFRLVEDPTFASNPVHNSGMIAQTPILPNAIIGVGLLRAAPRKPGSGEYRPEAGATGSRKAAVKFVLKF
jgi:hypothetical protein